MSNNSRSDESNLSPDSHSTDQPAAVAAALAVIAASVPAQLKPDEEDPFGVEENDRHALDDAVVDSEKKVAPAQPLPVLPVLPALHALADKRLYDSLDSVDPQNLSEEERQLTDANLLNLSTNQCKELCRKLPHYVKKAKGTVSAKNSISMTGSKNDMISRLLSWFFKMRGQSEEEAQPRTVDGTSFSEAEDARLLEIMMANECYSMIEGAFMSGTRQQIDAADASRVETTWNKAIAVIYNNSTNYTFPVRHHDENDVLHGFDPNHISIRRRNGTSLKNRYGMIKSRATILDKNWIQSGKNEPDNITQFVNLSVPLERSAYYFWLRMNQGGRNDVMVRCHLRRLDVSADSELEISRDPMELMQQWSGQQAAASNNADNGGAIGNAARHIEVGQQSVAPVEKGRAGNSNRRPPSVADKIESAIGKLVGTTHQEIQAMSELEQMVRRQDQDMDVIVESLDPDGKGSQQSRTFISRKQKQYRELRTSKAHNTHRLKAIRQGKDVGALPPPEEPETDDDEAYFLRAPLLPTTKSVTLASEEHE